MGSSGRMYPHHTSGAKLPGTLCPRPKQCKSQDTLAHAELMVYGLDLERGPMGHLGVQYPMTLTRLDRQAITFTQGSVMAE